MRSANSTGYRVAADGQGGLDCFHPVIRHWFTETIGAPTDVQAAAWPRIAAGEHVLISAPTGSGKTLTAFLWALQQLLTGHWESAAGEGAANPGPRVLYVSPLKALNTDIERNLEQPLAELRKHFLDAGLDPPAVRALTRSGDTPQAERRRMLRHPPEILITTPESLNILLTSAGGRALLHDLRTVIIDEIHAVASSKRGTHLVTAIERLVSLSGEFQRLALSATIRPMEVIADLVGGYQVQETGGAYAYRKRSVSLVHSAAQKKYDVKVRFPRSAPNTPTKDEEESIWDRLVPEFKRTIHRNRSTLFFANSRRLTEKITRLVNEKERRDLAYSHHGSLSREVRSVVERRLKDGELKAIVATNSLELGIDIGTLDEVVLIQTPRSIASAVQRVGRAGHGVGEVSRASLFPTGGRDFLDAAVVARGIADQDIEEVRPVTAPLDVLAQVILSMVVAEPWGLDELFAALRTSYPYHPLRRQQFDLVIDMLAGRYADSRIRELRPRISIDGVSQTVRARPGAARLLYMSGGTIADRGYFALRVEDSMAKLGELDEEFVWERSVGDTFSLGNQAWRIRKITHNDVLVAPARGGSAMAPFWRADAQDRSFVFCQKAGHFLAYLEGRLGQEDLIEKLREEYFLDKAAAREMVSFLEAQKAATGPRLPSARHLLVEHCRTKIKGGDQHPIIFHTLWSGAVNRPLTIALLAAWEERFGDPIEIFHDDDCVLVRLPHPMPPHELLGLVDPDQVENLLRRRLEKTGFFGARFRVNVATALLLPKAGFRNRTPLWMSRQRSKKLFESVSEYGDFPMLVETWRTCLQDDLDLENLKQVLRRVREGDLPITEVRTESPSPFAANLMWQHTNHYMYEDDTPETGRASKLRRDVLQELVFSSHLRPRLPRGLIDRFCHKVQRTAPGYAPAPGDDLADWVVERLLLPQAEWQTLLQAVVRDHGVKVEQILAQMEDRILLLTWPVSQETVVVALEVVPRLLWALGRRTLGRDSSTPQYGTLHGQPLTTQQQTHLYLLEERRKTRDTSHKDGETDPMQRVAAFMAEWLRFYGPLDPQWARLLFDLETDLWPQVIAELQGAQRWVVDELSRKADRAEICDAENLEILLRWLRADARPTFEALPVEKLPLFLAQHQGLTRPGDGVEDLQERLEKLLGYPAPAHLWESEFLPARLHPYYPAWLDRSMQESELLWFGCSQSRHLAFAFPADLDLLRETELESEDEAERLNGDGGLNGKAGRSVEETESAPEDLLTVEEIFPDPRGKYGFAELVERSGVSSAVLNAQIWRLAWQGQVTNDTFLAVRKGIDSKFKAADVRPVGSRQSGRRPGRRSAFGRWQASRPFLGNWSVVTSVTPVQDALEEEELIKERIRLLLGRYGLLCRELLTRELPVMRWGQVFRTLRLMELSGEVLAGYFFHGIRGLQFISHEAFRQLKKGLPEDAVFWYCAADPASLCGVDIEDLKGRLPPRQTTTHLVYQGTELVMISRRKGRHLEFRVGVEHPHLLDYLEVLKTLLTREVRPLTSIDVETINGQPVLSSPYEALLSKVFRVTREAQSIKLWKRY